MKGFSPELPASTRDEKNTVNPIEKKEQNATLSSKYTLVLVVAFAFAIGLLIASTSVDHILLENLFVACTIVICTAAIKTASTMNEPLK